jgi:hypothetical protein
VTVVPGPLAALDRFLCYKSKLAKGTLCAADAPANAGASCTTAADCGGGVCGKNQGPKGRQPLLADVFEERALAIQKATTLCAPAEVNDEPPVDPTLRLRGYATKDAKTSCAANAPVNPNGACATAADCGGGVCGKTPKHVPRLPLRLANQFGLLAVTTTKPVGVLVPTATAAGAPAPPPATGTVDDYKCYAVKPLTRLCAGDPSRTCTRSSDCDVAAPCLAKFSKGLGARIDDTFTVGDKAFALKKPTRFCTAAGRDGTPRNAPDGHLLCYSVKAIKKACVGGGTPELGTACKKEEDCGGITPFTQFCAAQPPVAAVDGLFATNGLGRERIDATGKPVELCVPTLLLP